MTISIGNWRYAQLSHLLTWRASDTCMQRDLAEARKVRLAGIALSAMGAD